MATERWAPVQGEPKLKLPAGRIPWAVHELAWRAYAAAVPASQSAERMAERGGFGWAEIIACIRGDYNALLHGSTIWDELREGAPDD